MTGIMNKPDPTTKAQRVAKWAKYFPGRHPAVHELMSYFSTDHLPDGTPMKGLVSEFEAFAEELVNACPDGPELTTALRKILEAKDCAVRSVVP